MNRHHYDSDSGKLSPAPSSLVCRSATTMRLGQCGRRTMRPVAFGSRRARVKSSRRASKPSTSVGNHSHRLGRTRHLARCAVALSASTTTGGSVNTMRRHLRSQTRTYRRHVPAAARLPRKTLSHGSKRDAGNDDAIRSLRSASLCALFSVDTKQPLTSPPPPFVGWHTSPQPPAPSRSSMVDPICLAVLTCC